MDSGIDTGPIFDVRYFPLSSALPARDIMPILLEEAYELFRESAPRILHRDLSVSETLTEAGRESRLYSRTSFDDLMELRIPLNQADLDRRWRALTWSETTRPRLLTADGVEIDSRLLYRKAPSALSGDMSSNMTGEQRRYFDPVWQTEVELSDLERELLHHPALRRLARVAHAGAASLLSVQTYSRLEHSLGLLALVSALNPADRVMRAAALVHDIGHLPLSHTVEKLAGVDHHDLGRDLIRGMTSIFDRHGLKVEDVIEAIEGRGRSRLSGGAGLKLDHFESFVRSAHVHGRTAEYPRETLASIHLEQSSVACDRGTAAYLRRLVVDEARRQTSIPNVRASAVMNALTERTLAPNRGHGTSWFAELDDRAFLSFLADHPDTSDDFTRFTSCPEAWDCVPKARGVAPLDFVDYRVPRLYVSAPLVNGIEIEFSTEELAELQALPTHFIVSKRPRPHPQMAAYASEGWRTH